MSVWGYHKGTVFIGWDIDEVKRVGNSYPVFGDV